MKLEELQRQFANQIYNPKQDKIFNEIIPSKVAIADRLEIYRNNVFGNFDSVLEIIYPITKKIVGENYFDNLCKKYHKQHPSKSGNLDDYGKYFYKLINDLKSEHKLPYLKDVAKIEWQCHFAYFTKDVAGFEVEKFQNLKEKELFKVRFKLHPSSYLLASKHPIYSVWKFSESDKKQKLNLGKLKNEWVLIERANWKTNVLELSEPEFLFLKHIKKGQNLYQIYQDLNKKYPNFDIGSLINKYISNGVISGYGL